MVLQKLHGHGIQPSAQSTKVEDLKLLECRVVLQKLHDHGIQPYAQSTKVEDLKLLECRVVQQKLNISKVL